nr:hypothetical protein [uncultured Albidiferax sp.]
MNQEPLQERDHFLAWDALPWVLNGQATREQEEAVAQHMPHCEDCQREWAYQQQLQQAVALAPAAAPDMDAGLQRLLNRIDLDQLCDQPSPAAAAQPAVTPRRRSAPWWGAAMAAAVLLPVLGWWGSITSPWSAHDENYRTLSQTVPATTGATAPTAVRIRVVPDPHTTLAQWGELLRTEQLQVVDGPNAVGAYTLALADKRSSADTLKRLRKLPGIVMAEPTEGRP